MSKYEAKVIEIKLEKHDNADSLSVCRIPDTGYVCVVRTSDWEGRTRGCYIEPDSILDTDRPEFAWLKDTTKVNPPRYHRVKAKRLRGVSSFGLLHPVDNNTELGTDLWEALGLDRWQPPEPSGDNQGCVKGPQRDFSKYDVENLKKYMNVFEPNESIMATLKINGQNCRICYQDEQIYVGSRNFWKTDVPGSDFWNAYRSAPGLEKLTKENPHLCVFGEAYGNIANMREDCPPGERRFRAFDIFSMNNNAWLNIKDMIAVCEQYEVPYAPIMYEGPFNYEKLAEIAESKSPLNPAQKFIEGIVISPLAERWEKSCGRVKLKLVSLNYLEKS